MIALYARISTEEQSKYSITSQIKECQKKANSDDTKEYIDEGHSGEFLERPALTQLRKDVKDGIITKIICYDPDRLARKLMNQLIITDEFERRGVPILFVSGEYEKTPEGQLFYSMRGAISEFEKAKINERMSRGRREKAKQGKVVKDYHIYGYGYDKETSSIYINEDEANIVRMIFHLFTTPNDIVKGINSIALYLTDQRIPTKKGRGVWHKQVVRQILMNRAYIGEFYQNRWNTEGMLGNKLRSPEDRVQAKERPRDEWIHIPCPTIIEIDQFEHAQQIMSEAKRRFAKDSSNPYLLSGIVRCGVCRNTMTGRKSKNWGTYVFEYTDIKNTAGYKLKGCGMRIKCEKLDNYVWETIKNFLNNPSEIAAAEEEEKPSYEDSEMLRIEKRLESIKAGRKRLLKLFSEGVEIGEEEIRDELKSLKEEESKLIEKIEELKTSQTSRKKSGYSQKLVQEAAEYYLSKDNVTFEDKQKIIRHIVREVQVFKDRIEIYSF